MPKRRFLFQVSRILILLLSCGGNNSAAQENPNYISSSSTCSPSSCGNITNIRFPFRLKAEPPSCGGNHSIFELDCQNDQAITNLTSRIYHVEEINYDALWVRIVDPGINRENLSSCPVYSDDDFSQPYPVSPDDILYWCDRNYVQVMFFHCLAPVSSSKYIKSAFCGDISNISVFSNSSSETYSYVMVSEEALLASDLEESCTVDRIVWAPARLSGNSSLASIYDDLAYGLRVSWLDYFCSQCRETDGLICNLEADVRRRMCGPDYHCGLKCKLEHLQEHLRDVETYVYYYVIKFRRFGIGGTLSYLTVRFGCGLWAIGLVAKKWRRRHLSMDETIEEFLQGQNDLTLIKYSYSEIKKMTNSFTERLGEGACGTVYKGKLRSGSDAAIKMMGESMPSEQEFISEVGTIGRIHHVNIVQLIGFCAERSSCALVYEFMPNRSLDKYIFSPQGSDGLTLSYEKMFGIAIGVARGIDYLHRGCNMQILHFDIKPHNILLDESFKPKISDFGLARLYSTDGRSTVNLTAARGTMGYMAPEMFYNNIGGVSYKADVYSFGMLLLEMAGRRKNLNLFADNESQIYFPSWAYDQFAAGKDIEIEDAVEDQERKIVKKIVIVALWCIQMKPSDRPPMNQVIEMLEGDSEVLQIPPKPFVSPWEIAKNRDE